MLITKIIGVILTVCSSGAIGIYFSDRIKDRMNELKELKKIILSLRGDIRYAMTPLPEALKVIASRHEGKFETFLEHLSKELNELGGITFQEIWKKCVEEDLNETALTKKDKVYLGQLGENLGYLDKEMQINTIDLYISQLETEIEELTGSMKEKTHLYNCLGIMLGIFIAIIII
ncbi:stage III sporulation protein AB [Anaeromicropila herbilytica]|uniref:Stage III sporulation protein AB n=1 Tax=Anaeromicropila herbilytica TaxID=2785025 RepID=A0A7R7EKZ6_9FIRM|nr:stage III sporulation protein AB [Anaeromicropila herbilytica]BCN30392.1 stage III sporulation protein AB [Anaeromicropila herbilytica]